VKPTLGNAFETGADIEIDIPRLLLSRLLVQASSGGGKSYALRRVVEQTAPHVQQVLLDIEGEFQTLREKFDYVICAPFGADAVANPQTATILARRLRETRVSAVIDLYDLKMPERKKFVRLFLEEFVEAPKSMWHPCIVVIDEAHHFCPEKDEAESMAAVNDLITRGRKRGLCGILATQRLSKLNKDSAAELHNKLLGLTVLDTDVKRAADDLGLSKKDATLILRDLEPGEFYCFGPALTKSVTKITVGNVITTHPTAGSGAKLIPPPPSEKIKAALAKLTDLPKEAEQEARTIEDFKRENANLKRELTLARKANPAPAKVEIKTIEKPVVGMKAIAGIQKSEADMRKALKSFRAVQDTINNVVVGMETQIDKLSKELQKVTNSAKAAGQRMEHSRPPAAPGAATINNALRASDITGPEQRILDAIAWMDSIGISEPEQTAVAFLAGYTVGGGGFNNPRGALRTKGLVDYLAGDRIRLTDSGRTFANTPNSALDNAELHRRVLDRLPGPEQKLLRVALECYPQEISDEELAERTGYTNGAGGYNNPRGRLRSLGLVTYPKPRHVRASDVLFPEDN
jgi:hypothetical protein